jgi:hypothetical protein
LSDSKYFVKHRQDQNGTWSNLYSDTLYSDSKISYSYKYEFSKNYITITGDGGANGAARTIIKGDFIFNGYELVGGAILGGVTVLSSGQVRAVRLLNPVNTTLPPDDGDWFGVLNKPLTNINNTVQSTSIGEYSKFFPAGWSNRPFQDNLVSVGKTSSSSGSSSGGGSSSTPQTLTTTTSVDTLTGIKKKKDIFKFDADPSGQVDKVTGFNAKEKDILSISKSAFEIDRGRFAVATNAKTLAKQLGKNVDIVYYRKTGELILNANGADPGYGEDGGVFAVLMGRPNVGAGSVQFY